MSNPILKAVVKATGKPIEVYLLRSVDHLPKSHSSGLREVDEAFQDILNIARGKYCDYNDCKTVYDSNNLRFL